MRHTTKAPATVATVAGMTQTGDLMSNEIIPQVFENSEFGAIRVIKDESGEPWFVAKDVCEILGLTNPTVATSRLDDDERAKFNLGRQGDTNVVNEYGLYSLVLASRKPEAHAFKRWVTHEVLPAIRRDGGYMVAKPDETPEETMARAVLIANETIKRQRADIERLEARNKALEPKAGFFDACMDGERWQSFTEVARLLHQYDRSMTRKRLFKLAYEDGLITHDKQASKLGIDRGYVRNYQPPAYFDQESGEQMRPKPYAKVTSKGVSWMFNRYCGRAE